MGDRVRLRQVVAALQSLSLLVAITADPCRGDRPRSVHPGDLIRVTAFGEITGFSTKSDTTSAYVPVLVGTLMSANRDGLLMALKEGGANLSLSTEQIRSVELWKRKNHETLGTGLGLGTGVAIGIAIGSSVGTDDSVSSSVDRMVGAVVGGVIGGLVGAIAGRSVGASIQRGEWCQIDIGTLAAGP